MKALLSILAAALTLTAGQTFAEGHDLVLGSASGISRSDADIAGEGSDTVLSTVYGMRPSIAEADGESRDTYLSTASVQPPRQNVKRSAEPSAEDLAALAYLAHVTGRTIPGVPSATKSSNTATSRQ